MPNYRRIKTPGATYFFTVNLEDRRSDALVRRIADLRSAWTYVQERHPFETLAVVVLPDHLHCIWRLPRGDENYATRWRLLKAHFTRTLARDGEAPAGRRAGERGLWQRRFWEHMVRDDDDLERCADYIHANPVKHGYVSRVDEWPHSTWKSWSGRGGGWDT